MKKDIYAKIVLARTLVGEVLDTDESDKVLSFDALTDLYDLLTNVMNVELYNLRSESDNCIPSYTGTRFLVPQGEMVRHVSKQNFSS